MMDAVLEAADTGNWAAYTEAQGGALVSRKDLVVRLNYEIEKEANCYAEDIKRVKGIFSPFLGEQSEVKTRLVKWRIVPKGSAPEGSEAGNYRASGAAWSSVNNCTEYNNYTNQDQREKIEFLVKSRGIEPDKRDIDCLLRGSVVDFGDNMKLKIKNNELIEGCGKDYWREV